MSSVTTTTTAAVTTTTTADVTKTRSEQLSSSFAWMNVKKVLGEGPERKLQGDVDKLPHSHPEASALSEGLILGKTDRLLAEFDIRIVESIDQRWLNWHVDQYDVSFKGLPYFFVTDKLAMADFCDSVDQALGRGDLFFKCRELALFDNMKREFKMIATSIERAESFLKLKDLYTGGAIPLTWLLDACSKKVTANILLAIKPPYRNGTCPMQQHTELAYNNEFCPAQQHAESEMKIFVKQSERGLLQLNDPTIYSLPDKTVEERNESCPDETTQKDYLNGVMNGVMNGAAAGVCDGALSRLGIDPHKDARGLISKVLYGYLVGQPLVSSTLGGISCLYCRYIDPKLQNSKLKYFIKTSLPKGFLLASVIQNPLGTACAYAGYNIVFKAISR
nr:hypothetical protein [Endozoicomonas sp.]